MSDSVSKYNQDKTGTEADTNSLRADWYAVGNDLWKAIKQYERETKIAS